MGEIVGLTYMDYLFIYGDNRTAFSDYAVINALESGGNVFSIIDKGIHSGYICVLKEREGSNVLYVYILPYKREKGIFNKLFSYVSEICLKPIRITISQSHEKYEVILSACKRNGYGFQSSSTVFRGEAKDFVRWEEYMASSGEKLTAMLKRQGFFCTSFEETDKEIWKQIYNSAQNEFCNSLDVKSFIDNINKQMDKQMSFATIRNGELAAYTLVSRPDKSSAVFEQISVAKKYIGSGCILVPFSESMSAFKKFGCKRAAYAMYEKNTHAKAFREKLLMKVTSSSKIMENYVLN